MPKSNRPASEHITQAQEEGTVHLTRAHRNFLPLKGTLDDNLAYVPRRPWL